MYKKEHMISGDFAEKKMDVNCLSPYFPGIFDVYWKSKLQRFQRQRPPPSRKLSGHL